MKNLFLDFFGFFTKKTIFCVKCVYSNQDTWNSSNMDPKALPDIYIYIYIYIYMPNSQRA